MVEPKSAETIMKLASEDVRESCTEQVAKARDSGALKVYVKGAKEELHDSNMQKGTRP